MLALLSPTNAQESREIAIREFDYGFICCDVFVVPPSQRLRVSLGLSVRLQQVRGQPIVTITLSYCRIPQ